MRTVYLDNNATTPVAAEVFDAMRPFFVEHYGNPSSVHRQGTSSAAALRDARKTIAGFLGCDGSEITFTGCGTESDNISIRGVLEGRKNRAHAITTAVEHVAVLSVLRHMETLGHELTVLGVDANGMIDIDELRSSIRDDTVLVSTMNANNETGVLFPIEEIASIVKESDALLHTDAVQSIGKIPLDLSSVPIDMIALSAHKFHGPKGVGALFVRRGTKLAPITLGGSQERGLRPGTENVGGIVAMARACELAAQHLGDYQSTTRLLRDKFETTILDLVPDTFVNGANSPRLPNTSNICFRGIDGRSLQVLLDEVGICASAGSACKSGAGTASYVLAAMGVSEEDAIGSMRFSLSGWTTEEEIDYALEQIPSVVERMRARS